MRSILKLAIIGLLFLPSISDAEVGKAEFVIGEVQVINSAGLPRNINKGDEINQGDTVVTKNNGRIQIRFSDNGYISLQPDSRFRIDEYRFNSESAAANKGFFSLLKGGLRALTGLITRKNKNAYQVNTAVATIGIRGTHFTVRLCAQDCLSAGKRIEDGLYANVTHGAIIIQNSGGSLDLQRGQTGLVRGVNIPPNRIERMPINFSPQRDERRQQKAENGKVEPRSSSNRDQRPNRRPHNPPVPPDSRFSIALLGEAPPNLLVPLPPREGDTFSSGGGPLTGTVLSPIIMGIATDVDDDPMFPAGEFDIIPATAVEIDASNALVAFHERTEVNKRGTTTVLEAGFNSRTTLFWGRWTGGTMESTPPVSFTPNQSLHYVFGAPATNFPTTGSATYAFIGGTRSTDNLGGVGAGVLAVNSSLVVDFGSSRVDVNLFISHSGTIDLSRTNNAISANFGFGYVKTTTPTPVCASGCPVFVRGFFTGPGGIGAGLVYEIQPSSGNVHIHGTAAFSR